MLGWSPVGFVQRLPGQASGYGTGHERSHPGEGQLESVTRIGDIGKPGGIKVDNDSGNVDQRHIEKIGQRERSAAARRSHREGQQRDNKPDPEDQKIDHRAAPALVRTSSALYRRAYAAQLSLCRSVSPSGGNASPPRSRSRQKRSALASAPTSPAGTTAIREAISGISARSPPPVWSVQMTGKPLANACGRTMPKPS